MSKTIIRAVILLVAGAVLLCGCEKKKEDTPKPNPPKVNISVEFEHKVIKCKIRNPVKINVYIDHIIVKNPASKGIKFQSSNPSVLSVTDQCVIMLQKRDSALVYLTLEDNDKIYRDTLRVFSHLPSKMESYYIMKGFDLNRDSCMSDYEMSRIEEVDKWYQEDAFLLKNVKSVYASVVPSSQSSLCKTESIDFSFNANMTILTIFTKDVFYCDTLNVIFPSETKYETLKLISNWDTPLCDMNIPSSPDLDTLQISCFTFPCFSIKNAKKMRYIMLGGDLPAKIDLSQCPNLNNIDLFQTIRGTQKKFKLILSPQVYSKYINKDPDLKIVLPPDMTVVASAE